jgi:hypothetical protein
MQSYETIAKERGKETKREEESFYFMTNLHPRKIFFKKTFRG